jgi:hypothetical protein
MKFFCESVKHFLEMAQSCLIAARKRICKRICNRACYGERRANHFARRGKLLLPLLRIRRRLKSFLPLPLTLDIVGSFSSSVENDYLFNKKKENLFHTNFIFRVDHRDGSSRVRVEGWEHK